MNPGGIGHRVPQNPDVSGTWKWLRGPTVAVGLAVALLAPGVAQAAPNDDDAAAFKRYSAMQGRMIDRVDDFWVGALAGAGVSYSSPSVKVADRGSKLKSDCGQELADPADARKAFPAFYCRSDRTVYISSGWMNRVIYSSFHRGGVAAVLAHEFGHHVQRSIGIADPSVERQELQADCLAGIWVRHAQRNGTLDKADVADARKALRSLGDTAHKSKVHHGTPKERSGWFNRGYRSGDAYVCNH